MSKRLMRNTYYYWTFLLISLVLSETGQSSPTNLDSLPRDVIYNVQEYLDLDDYKAMRSLSKNMYDRLGFFEHFLPTITVHVSKDNLFQVLKSLNRFSVNRFKNVFFEGPAECLDIVFLKAHQLFPEKEDGFLNAHFIEEKPSTKKIDIDRPYFRNILSLSLNSSSLEIVETLKRSKNAKSLCLETNHHKKEQLLESLPELFFPKLERLCFKEKSCDMKVLKENAFSRFLENHEKTIKFFSLATFSLKNYTNKFPLQISSLSITSGKLKDEQALNVLNSQYTDIDFSFNNLINISFIESSFLESLQSLKLNNNLITSAGLEKILGLSTLKHLKILEILENPIYSFGENKICIQNNAMRLEKFLFSSSYIGKEDTEELILINPLKNLKTLGVRNNYGFNVFFCDTIQNIDFAKSQISWNQIKNIDDNRLQLLNINLSYNYFSPNDILLLSNAKGLAELQNLNLTHCRIDNVGFLYLISSKNLTKIRNLILSYNNINKEIAAWIEEKHNLKTLKHLFLQKNKLLEKDFIKIKSMPFVNRTKIWI